MKLDSIGNYKRDVTLNKVLFTITIIAIIVSQFIYKLEQRKDRDKLVVVDQNNNALLATNRVLTPLEREAKIKDHVSDFYILFHQFGSELEGVNSWEYRIAKALKLGDRSVEQEFVKLKESGFYKTVQENDWKVGIQVIKVELNMDVQPVTGIVYAIQTLERQIGDKHRNMNATFTIDENVGIENDNPHGYKILDYEIFDNAEIRIDDN